jgi:hypothetical protein
MSRYSRDDGTFAMGLFCAGLAIASFCAGYSVRDSGYVFNASKTPTTREVKAK